MIGGDDINLLAGVVYRYGIVEILMECFLKLPTISNGKREDGCL